MQTIKDTKKTKNQFLPALFGIAIYISLSHQAYSHPHDTLAQCQLPNGKWKMCDDTTHDLSTNQHVPKDNKATISKISTLEQTQNSSNQPNNSFSIPFNTTCASGFTKAGEQKNGDRTMDWYVCSTPVISCPSYTQKNGLKAHVKPTAIVQLIGGSPDSGGPQKFRVQYKCDYSFNVLPEG